jgi:hypothetical protein
MQQRVRFLANMNLSPRIVVYDRAITHPRLLRVQDPFAKLLVRAKGGVVVDEAVIFKAAEIEGVSVIVGDAARKR